jgi:hypothetical protein
MPKTTGIRRTGNGAAAEATAQKLGQPPVDPESASTMPAPARGAKTSLLRQMLLEPGGAGLQSLMTATGWQAHTVRAALSGLRKSGLSITRRTGDQGPIYNSATTAIAVTEGAAPASKRSGGAKPRHRKALAMPGIARDVGPDVLGALQRDGVTDGVAQTDDSAVLGSHAQQSVAVGVEH